MHKALKNSRFAPRKNFSTFLTADCKCEKKMRLLQENSMKIGPNMLNNIFIALRTPQSPLLLRDMHPVCQHFARLHAPCAQAAVEQNADAVGKSVHGGGTFFHGWGTFFHGFYFKQGWGQKKGDAT